MMRSGEVEGNHGQEHPAVGQSRKKGALAVRVLPDNCVLIAHPCLKIGCSRGALGAKLGCLELQPFGARKRSVGVKTTRADETSCKRSTFETP